MIQDWLGPVAGIVAGLGFVSDAVRYMRRGHAGWLTLLSSIAGGALFASFGWEMRGQLIPSLVFCAFSAVMVLVPIRVWVRVVAGKKGLAEYDREMADSLPDSAEQPALPAPRQRPQENDP